MAIKHYTFQRDVNIKERSMALKVFEVGLSVPIYILLALHQGAKDFLELLPNSYPQFAIMKKMFGIGARYRRQFEEQNERRIITLNLSRLKQRGLIARDADKKTYQLTEKGERIANYIESRRSILSQPWDGKFRILVFDIPEKYKGWREWLRHELILMQFQQLQKSVYIGKFPLPADFYKTLFDVDLSQYLFVLTVGDIDREEQILKMFE